MNQKPLRVLFQGDSITDAFRRPEEINPAYQLGNGYAFLASSRLALEYPGRFKFLNRGASGQTVGDLDARWDADALSLKPDAVSLLIGVNSTIRTMRREQEESLSEFRDLYGSLISRLLDLNPRTLVILVEPFLLITGQVDLVWQEHLQERRGVIRELAKGFGAILVPAQESFQEATKRAPAAYWAYDGIHPTHAGAGILADAWLKAAKPALMERIR